MVIKWKPRQGVWHKEFPKLFDSLTQKEKERIFEYFFISSLSLTIRRTIVNLRWLERYCRERPCIKWVLLTAFLEIYWLIELTVVSIIAPGQTKKYFFQWRQKNTRVSSLHCRGFSMLIASNSRVTLTKVKNTQETLKCSRKKQITV